MFSKIVAVAAIALTLVGHAHAHAAISPALGVSGTPARSDVQKPSTAKPCGTINIASTIDTSTPVVANADGSFVVTVTNFNAGQDGSRQVSLTVDSTGAGKSFVAGTVSVNGDLAPTDVGSQQVTASLPSGTTCTGGTTGDLCLAAFKTAGGFGNCVVVQQAAISSSAASSTNSTAAAATSAAATSAAAATTAAEAASTSSAAAASASATTAAADSTATDTATTSSTTAASTGATNGTTTTHKHHHHHHHNGTAAVNAKANVNATLLTEHRNEAIAKEHAANAAGTRAARALRAGIFSGGKLAKRNVLNWVWA